MARRITELTVAGAVDGANDLLWLEQSGLARKVSPDDLIDGVAAPAKKTATASVSTAGWYRVGVNASATGRGSAVFTVGSEGGGLAPSNTVFRVNKGWQTNGTDLSIILLQSGINGSTNPSLEKIRITYDATTTFDLFVEVYLNPTSAANVRVEVEPDLMQSVALDGWSATAFTAGATADYTEVIDLLLNYPVMGYSTSFNSGSQGFLSEGGRLFLHADVKDTNENETPYIQMSQDGGNTNTRIGLTDAAGEGPAGETFLGYSVGNSTAIHHVSAGGEIGIGVFGQAALRINDSDELWVADQNKVMREFKSTATVGTDTAIVVGPKGDANILTGVAVGDTRDTNSNPSNYSQLFTAEFKQQATIGTPGDGTYAGLITLAPWSDGSGGHASQIALNQAGMFLRQESMSTTSWGGNAHANWRPLKIGAGYDDGAGVSMQVHYPQNAALSLDIASNTGFFKIRLPFDLGSNIMMTLVVKGYDYDSSTGNGGAWAIAISGYSFSTDWANTSANTMYGNPPFRQVRFYKDTVANECGFALGSIGDVHEYPKIWVDEFLYSFASDPYDGHNILEGLTVEFVNVETNMTMHATEAFLNKQTPNSGHFIPAGRIYPQSTNTVAGAQTPDNLAGYIEAPTGDYGSIQVDGYAGVGGSTWVGYSIGGRHVFMDDGSNTSGLYDDTNNKWIFQATNNGRSSLWHSGVIAAETQLYNGLGVTSSLSAYDHANVQRDVGWNVLPAFGLNTTDTLEAQHCGALSGSDNTTAYTLTLAASGDLDFPVEGLATHINGGTAGDITINEGTGTTLYFNEPGTGLVDTTGGVTLGIGGTINIWRKTSTVYWCWGSEITFTP